eukprot:554401-Alexandrium_andersonii.AAC.1
MLASGPSILTEVDLTACFLGPKSAKSAEHLEDWGGLSKAHSARLAKWESPAKFLADLVDS